MELIEIIGFLFAVVGIYYSAKSKIIYWPLSIISSLAYMYFFFKINLYADSLLQIFFILSALYAWSAWNKNIATHKKLNVSLASNLYLLKIASIALVFGIIIGLVFERFTDASFPYLDSTLFSFSILATYLSARAYLQNWYFWLVINAAYVCMYISKEAYITAVLYVILFVLAYFGLNQWKKINQKDFA